MFSEPHSGQTRGSGSRTSSSRSSSLTAAMVHSPQESAPEEEVMAIRIVRLGTPRHPSEGLRIGTVRRPPRGVKKEEYATRDFFDTWLPELAPSAGLVSYAY